MNKRTFHIVIALDFLLNALTGGYPGETVSARCHRRGVIGKSVPWGYMRRFVDWLFRAEGPGHCERAYRSCLLGLYGPIDYHPTDKR